jgi:hypothetical protein
MEMLVAFTGDEYEDWQQAGWHSVIYREKPVVLCGTQRGPRNVPAKHV